MELNGKIKKISSMINSCLSGGLIPDNETINFIKSGYGLSEPEEISCFIENGDDSGAIIEMLSYPADSFRESIEELIPLEGFSISEIHCIEKIFPAIHVSIFILFNNRKIFLTKEDSLTCRKRFLQRLNLDLPMNYFAGLNIFTDIINIRFVKAYLRKKKFHSNYENHLFLNDLIFNYQSVKNNSADEFKILLGKSVDFLSGSDRRAFDILTEKKYYYENTILESEEFARLLKTYSMEFIMMKRIQPPLVSVDEARTIISIIDRLASVVYGTLIPSVRNDVIDSF